MKPPVLPQFYELMDPTLVALRQLGGSASNDELMAELVRSLDLPEDVVSVPHGTGSKSEIEYRAYWARTYLRKAGLVENSGRAVWSLTRDGAAAIGLNGRELARKIARESKPSRRGNSIQPELDGTAAAESELEWQDQLLTVLRTMDPIAFERLCQRLLRESGFIEVEVTKRSGDGGIDGRGTIRIGGLISFNVLFQSKRYKGNIGPETVRDFRGAMVGRADKGLLISTGGFTPEARREATRDGAPPIDLIDGQLLADKLKELGLGVRTTLVEQVEVLSDWFATV